MAKTQTPKAKSARKGFPTKKQILEFVRESQGKVGKREIARAFQIKGNDRILLKQILKELKAEGLLGREEVRRTLDPKNLPPVLVVEIHDLDEDGELIAKPAAWDETKPAPKIYLSSDAPHHGGLTTGDRVLARLRQIGKMSYDARTIRKLENAPLRILGCYEKSADGGRLRPIDKRAKKDYLLSPDHAANAVFGDLVLAEVLPGQRGHRLGLRQVRVIEKLGKIEGLAALSLIAIHEQNLPHEFSTAALQLAEKAKGVSLGKRQDLRAIPLVTIDGADARDFDDAVFAEPDVAADNPGGWHLLVAIADVAHYVRPGDALDQEARRRGNSTYFPDRVVPMLPEALSNGWCSLVPQEERPCLAAHLWIDADGQILRHKFVRGLMKSAARLTYEEVQAAADNNPSPRVVTLMDSVIHPLYGAYRALAKGREERGALDLDLPERQVKLNDAKTDCEIFKRARLDSHRLIEEFMIAANIAAAKELERLRQPCMYRVHEPPDPLKIEALAEVLESFGYRLARGQVIRPKSLNAILKKFAGRPESPMVSELILRSQSQALYSPKNRGHFGLALTHYAHFTSPIRRYADLLVHRALIAGLKLGPGGLPKESAEEFESVGDEISTCERRSIAAERQAVDRFTAAYLVDQRGENLPGRISSITRFGLFVTLDESGGDGLVPLRRLDDDHYEHNRSTHSLVGRRWGKRFHLGDHVVVRLDEVDPLTGSIIFTLIEGGQAQTQIARKKPARKKPAGKKRRKKEK